MKSLDNPLEESAKKEMNAKYSFLLLVTFEGAIRLHEWTSLKSILQVVVEFHYLTVGSKYCAGVIAGLGMYGGHCSLRRRCYPRRYQIGDDAGFPCSSWDWLQELLNAIILVPERTKPLISRWLRVVIELSLHHSDATTMGLMPQLMQMLRNDEVRGLEAHWIAATLWNKALDHLG